MVSNKVVQRKNAGIGDDTGIFISHCPDHSRPERTITSCLFEWKNMENRTSPNDGEQSESFPHSIINETRKSTWLKEFAVTDMGLYRCFHRQEKMLFLARDSGQFAKRRPIINQLQAYRIGSKTSGSSALVSKELPVLARGCVVRSSEYRSA
ncbi:MULTISPECIES: hypothetical protein [Paraburkholderia]|uniref:hypothetical protein n=1 Tax=Paraburkholderia TaxID=1822464 RepID=UPI0038BC4956